MTTVLPDWSAIDSVLLDMDGTILDLKFDNDFWLERVPALYAARNALSLEDAKARLRSSYQAKQGTLDWYCIDYWSRTLDLDLPTLKREARAEIAWIPGAERFVRAVRARGKRLALVTNAHPETLAVKDEQLDFRGHFDAVYSSHPFGAPKESVEFWRALHAAERFDAERTLFVDDSLPVLEAARAHGIRWICAIAHPDSSRPRRLVRGFPSVDAVHELLPIDAELADGAGTQ
jgi:HAD superfamily hydrolase (TIGR01509 family)